MLSGSKSPAESRVTGQEAGSGVVRMGEPIGTPRFRARVAVALSLMLLFTAMGWRGILPLDSTRALLLICAVEIFSLPIYRYFERRSSRRILQAYFRWITDILLITAALHFLGGVQAFMFSFLYCLVILTSSMMARKRDTYLMATLSALSYGALLLLEHAGVLRSRSIWDVQWGPDAQGVFVLWSFLFLYFAAYFSSVFATRLRERGRSLEIVNAISRVSSSSLALKEILHRTLDFLLVHLKAEAGAMRVPGHWEDLRTTDRGIWRLPPDLPESERTALDRLAKALAEENEPVIIRDIRKDPRSRHLGIRWVASLIAAPLVHRGEHVGLFILLEHKSRTGVRSSRFRQEDLDLMNMITRQVAPAIVNARLFTNLEEANRNIRRAQDAIVKQEKFEALGEMVTGMGHQFRNPLLAIGAAAKRISKGNRIPDGMRFYVQIIQNETEKLERILKDVPGFNIGSECNRVEVDVNALIDRALALVFENGNNAGFRIERDFEKLKDPLPSVDPDQLEVALYNLFSNGREAMGPGGGTLKVKIRVESGVQSRLLRIEVSDTGGGIPPEVVGNIFNPFYTTKHWGAGLGLTMAHLIVENHGGEIHVLNRPGEGVTIRITIPNA